MFSRKLGLVLGAPTGIVLKIFKIILRPRISPSFLKKEEVKKWQQRKRRIGLILNHGKLKQTTAVTLIG